LSELGCGQPIGPRAELCPRCRKRRKRRLDAGLPASAYAEGGRRGRLRLGQLTAAERRLREELQQALEFVREESYRDGFEAGVARATGKAVPIIRRLERKLREQRRPGASIGA
jgi:hypothetical protein